MKTQNGSPTNTDGVFGSDFHHTHLPKLEEAQIIDYETETGHIQFVGGELEQQILTLVEPYDTPE